MPLKMLANVHHFFLGLCILRAMWFVLQSKYEDKFCATFLNKDQSPPMSVCLTTKQLKLVEYLKVIMKISGLCVCVCGVCMSLKEDWYFVFKGTLIIPSSFVSEVTRGPILWLETVFLSQTLSVPLFTQNFLFFPLSPWSNGSFLPTKHQLHIKTSKK